METLIGAVPDEWSLVPLDKVCELRSGPSGALRAHEVSERTTGVPVVTSADLRLHGVHNGRLQRVAVEAAERLSAYRLQPGDILTSRTGDLGRQALIGEAERGWLYGTGCIRLRPRGDVLLAPYLLYYLAHPQVVEWIHRQATGSAIPTIRARVLGTLQVPLPPPSVQARIVEPLALLDVKILVHDEIVRATAELRRSLTAVLYRGDATVDHSSPGPAGV